ncbi:MAG: hypothetical protein EA366_09990 [Spirulina sp. DLM2.Bin59]|nr:MAG: hypothetical protein EA366_09990 [Spirulina sp. DLM2.Bin59]
MRLRRKKRGGSEFNPLNKGVGVAGGILTAAAKLAKMQKIPILIKIGINRLVRNRGTELVAQSQYSVLMLRAIEQRRDYIKPQK